MTDDPFAPLTRLLTETLAPDLQPAGRFIDLMHPDIRFVFPYAPKGFPKLITGRDALSEYLAALGSRLRVREVTLTGSVVNSGRTQAVLEFTAISVLLPALRLYPQDYVSVLTLKEGRILTYRDYWNPLIVLKSFDKGEDHERV